MDCLIDLATFAKNNFKDPYFVKKVKARWEELYPPPLDGFPDSLLVNNTRIMLIFAPRHTETMGNTSVILWIIVGIALLVWVPAIVISVSLVLRKNKRKNKKK